MMAFLSWLRQRAFLALCCCALTACSTPVCRQWALVEMTTGYPCFNSGRLYLDPDNNYSHIQLELDRDISGIRMYVNILLLYAPPCSDDPDYTNLEIKWEEEGEGEGEETPPLLVKAYRLKGGQRLLIPSDIADQLIETLLKGRSFTVHLGRYRSLITPVDFAILYQKWLAIPMAEQQDRNDDPPLPDSN